jgi:hypothetical protein
VARFVEHNQVEVVGLQSLPCWFTLALSNSRLTLNIKVSS